MRLDHPLLNWAMWFIGLSHNRHWGLHSSILIALIVQHRPELLLNKIGVNPLMPPPEPLTNHKLETVRLGPGDLAQIRENHSFRLFLAVWTFVTVTLSCLF